MKKPFANITLSQLHTLCNTLADTQVRHVTYIKRKYLEKALSFDETLLFLKDLNIINYKSNELLPSKSFSNTYDSIDDFKRVFLPVLFSSKGEISKQLKLFLLNFETDTNKIFFKATELEKIKFSAIRNLLLELEFIHASTDNTTYFVNSDFTDLFVKQFSRNKLSPKTLKQKLTENESIGLNAEMAVINFEIKRLTDFSIKPNEIEHTSQENVLAGYDIRSFENYFDKNSKRIYRYIEVKAVSVQDFKFYWSRNEIEISKVFGERYFLYLLPVILNNTFDFEKLTIINNPFKNIYLNGTHWKKEEEIISFTKNID